MMSCHPLKNKAMKRSFLSVAVLLVVAPYLFAQRPDTLKLWPAGTPAPYHTDYRYEGKDYSEAMLIVFRAPKPNGLAVVMCPGGGYMMEAQEHEGTDLAGWFTARGITYCMLQYRPCPCPGMGRPEGRCLRMFRRRPPGINTCHALYGGFPSGLPDPVLPGDNDGSVLYAQGIP